MNGIETILLVAVGFALGGILKGATGAGAPLVAVPVMAVLYGVPFAVTVSVMPNLIPNFWQAWKFRSHLLPRVLTLRFALAGALGAAIGTFILAFVPQDILALMVAGIVLFYILFRQLMPDWSLEQGHAVRLAIPVGTLAGMLQGASGISAPASITFLNAMRLERLQFMATISVFFAALGIVQIPLLVYWGFLTPERFLLSCAAMLPLMAAMPLGAYLVRYISKEAFDRMILVMLAGLAIKLAYGAVF